MNNRTQDDRFVPEWVQFALDAFADSAGVVAHYRPDAGLGQVELQVTDQVLRYAVDFKKNIDRFATLSAIKAGDTGAPTLLFTFGLSAEMVQRCRELEISFIDTAGNAYIKAPGVLIFVAGRRNDPAILNRTNVSKGSTPAALKLIFALLSQPALLQASYRQLSEVATIASGSIKAILDALEARGYWWYSEADGPQLVRRHMLLNDWVSGYAGRLRPKLRSLRFSSPDPAAWQCWQFAPEEAAWGGEVAAARLTGQLNPASQTLYVAPVHMDGTVRRLVQSARLKADPQGHIEIVEAFWHMGLLHDEQGLVPPVLIYADLLNSHDPRNIEIAKLVRENWIPDA